ncbi:hypothetical protein VTO58DRAFT_108333 [Aureobasidium pullulans]
MGRRWHLNEEEGNFMLSHAHRSLWNKKNFRPKFSKNFPKLNHLHPSPFYNPKQHQDKQKEGSRRESNPGPLAIGLEFSRFAMEEPP